MSGRRGVASQVAGSIAALALAMALADGSAWATGSPAAWRTQTSPDPSSVYNYNTLDAVAATSGGAWAVGTYSDSGGVGRALVIRRSSSSGWAQVSSPAAWGSALTAVTATSGGNAWAVGSHNGVAGVLILHWNGTAWSRQHAPYTADRDLPGLTGLYGVAALSASNAWAVGGWGENNCSGACGPYGLIEHWNGDSWVKQCCPLVALGAPGAGSFSAVAAADGSHVWAVGRKWNGAGTIPHVNVLQWNGTRWTSPTTPDPRRGNLLGVTSVSATNVWAVGSYVNTNGLVRTLVLHSNGAGWKKIVSPNMGTSPNVLTAVHAVSATDVWAVGHQGGKPLIEHYDGTRWTVSTIPDVGNAALSGVSGNAYAVGVRSSSTTTQTLVLYYG